MTQPSQAVETDITWDDVRALQQLRGDWPSGPIGWLFRWLGPDSWSWRADVVVLGMFLTGMAFLLVLNPTREALFLGTLTAGPISIFGALLLRSPWGRAWSVRRGDIAHKPNVHGLVGLKMVQIDAIGVWRTDGERREFWLWRAIEPEFTAATLYLHFDRHRAVIVPRRAFGSDEEFRRFGHTAAESKQSAVAVAVPEMPSTAAVSPTFDLSGEDIGRAFLADAPGWTPSAGAIFYTLITALPVWGMCPVWNPAWQSWVAFPVGAAFQFQVLFGHKLIERRRRRLLGHRAIERAPNPESFQGVALGVDAVALTEVTSLTRMRTRWTAVKNCDVTQEVAVFHEGSGIAVIPRRVFDSDDAYFDFVEKALEYRRKAFEAAA